MNKMQEILYNLSSLSLKKDSDNIDKFLTEHIKKILDLQLKNKNIRKYLLISSVGNNSIHRNCKWNYKDRNYDILFIYYEDYNYNESEFYLRMKGKKFVQYYYIFQHSLIDLYDYIFILDNDNLISGKEITKLFLLATKLNANLLAPSVRIKDINNNKVLELLDFYNNKYKSNNKNFWFIKKFLPEKLVPIYNHVIKYSTWIHMIQEKNLKDKYIKEVNLVEDGRSIINTSLIKRFRKNLNFMKLFESGILFDSVLSNYSNFKRIYIIDYIYYIHLDPYKDKITERKESKKILEYIKKNNIINNFKIIWPDLINIKYHKNII